MYGLTITLSKGATAFFCAEVVLASSTSKAAKQIFRLAMAERLAIKRFPLPVGRLRKRYVTGLSKYLCGADQLLNERNPHKPGHL